MSDEIGYGRESAAEAEEVSARQLVPMRVGQATVYVESIQDSVDIRLSNEQIEPAAPEPDEAFEKAVEVLKEYVRTIGEQVQQLGSKAAPEEITAEFALSFGVTGKTQILPILLTGETKATAGLKITAVWCMRDTPKGNLKERD